MQGNNSSLQQYSDEEIWSKAKPIIMKILFSRYAKYKREHEDIMQVAMVAIFEKLTEYDKQKGDMDGFIYGVANIAIKRQIRLLTKIRQKEVNVDFQLNRVPIVERENETDIISDFEKTLTKRERVALEMRLDGAGNTKIYNVLNPGNKKRHIGKAMQPLWHGIAEKYKKWRKAYEN